MYAAKVHSPSFDPHDFPGNVRQLCRLYGFPDPSAVPVDRILLVWGKRKPDEQLEWPIGPGCYEDGLIQYRLMERAGHPTFDLTRELRQGLIRYYGDERVEAVANPRNKDRYLRALLGDTVSVTLSLQPGYREYFTTRPTVEDLIRAGWEEHEAITPSSPQPLVRLAVEQLFRDIESRQVQIAPDENGEFPNPAWTERAHILLERMTPGHWPTQLAA